MRCRGTLRRRRARRYRRRSRRSPTTGSCPTATRARWWPRTARSTGCAFPRFDSPSVFGALLDRGAGGFRFGPFGINVPSDRIYEPGTNTVVTSWKTPTGWVVVRDALTMGPRRGEDTVTPHTRPPSDEDADHALVRTAHCIDGRVEIDLVCEPGVRLWPRSRRVDAEPGSASSRRQGRRAGAAAPDRHARRHRGRPGSGPPRAARRRDGLLRIGLERRSACPDQRRRGRRSACGDDAASGATGSPARRFPTTSWGR